MAFSSNYGVKLWLKNVPRYKDVNRNDFVLFSESNSRFLVEVPKGQVSRFESITRDVPCAVVGEVTGEPRLLIYGLKDETVVDADLGELLDTWKRGLEAEI